MPEEKMFGSLSFNSTTIDLYLSLFQWTSFRKAKGGIKVHTLFDVVTHIPAYIHITETRLHDVNAMDVIPYESKFIHSAAETIADTRFISMAKLHCDHLRINPFWSEK